MLQKIYKETASEAVYLILKKLMNSPMLTSFRLAGGTSLSLQLGHRQSIDIDLFTDEKYGSIDFSKIDKWLEKTFIYVDYIDLGIKEVGFGKFYYVGESEKNCVKLDILYTDKFIRKAKLFENIRFASPEDIAAMKLDVILNGGRKKDFWDIAELLDIYSMTEIINFYCEKNPYIDAKNDLIPALTNFSIADEMEDPVCLRNRAWQLVKLDIIEAVEAASITP